MSVRAPPFVPAKTTSASFAIWLFGVGAFAAQLGGQRRDVLALYVQTVAIVDCDNCGPAAAADAFDRAQCEAAVARRLAGANAELSFELFHYLLCACEPAGDVRAHLDERLPYRREPEHVVER